MGGIIVKRFEWPLVRTECQALTITRLTHSPYTTKLGYDAKYYFLSARTYNTQ